jgi:hypothetical protein
MFFTTSKIGMDPDHDTLCHDQDTSHSRAGVGLAMIIKSGPQHGAEVQIL